MALSTVTRLCDHPHHPPPERFHHPRLKPCTINHDVPVPTSSLVAADSVARSASMSLATLVPHASAIIQCLSFHVWFISLTVLFSRFVPVTACAGTSFLQGWLASHCVDMTPFTSSTSSDVHFGCFHLLAVVSSAAVNTGVQTVHRLFKWFLPPVSSTQSFLNDFPPVSSRAENLGKKLLMIIIILSSPSHLLRREDLSPKTKDHPFCRLANMLTLFKCDQ